MGLSVEVDSQNWAMQMWASAGQAGVLHYVNNGGSTWDTLSGTAQTSFTQSPDIWYHMTMELSGGVAKLYVDNSLLYTYNLGASMNIPIGSYVLTFRSWGQRDIDNILVTSIQRHYSAKDKHTA